MELVIESFQCNQLDGFLIIGRNRIVIVEDGNGQWIIQYLDKYQRRTNHQLGRWTNERRSFSGFAASLKNTGNTIGLGKEGSIDHRETEADNKSMENDGKAQSYQGYFFSNLSGPWSIGSNKCANSQNGCHGDTGNMFTSYE